ncbi:MAG: NUDIX hydrolase [Coprococcus catus]|nr:NUDIX hydrolase [Coprococcus catus]MBD9002549.1 NUDIX hydrolase [Coprococcus catus]
MDRITKIIQETHHRFLNLFCMDVRHRNGEASEYYVASRAKSVTDLKAVTHRNEPDGVSIYSVYGEQKDRVVLVRQYRYPLGDYVYEFPAGLVESGEAMTDAAVREFHEETGLHLKVVLADDMYTKPRFTTVGMTDEACGMVYGYASGVPDNRFEESSEDIQVVLADKKEVRRILKEENVAMMCAYMLLHFLKSEGDPLGFVEMQEK